LLHVIENAQSTTLEFSNKKTNILEPINGNVSGGQLVQFKTAMKTKAGTNGKQLKVNQDTAFIEQRLQFGLKCYCVCDGHGLNGHTVSAFIKTHMISKYLLI
jgi:hypothetical protein